MTLARKDYFIYSSATKALYSSYFTGKGEHPALFRGPGSQATKTSNEGTLNMKSRSRVRTELLL